MLWYGIIVVVCLAAAVSGRLYWEVVSLRKVVQRQNRLLKKNLAEMRDEYARLSREMKRVGKEKDKKARKN